MITPRRTRLLRVPSLHQFRHAIASCCPADPESSRRTAVLVPSRSAARELHRTLEQLLTRERGRPVLPALLTRDEWYARMHESAGPPGLLTPLERDVLMAASARQAIEQGSRPPFSLRPGLVAAMLALYDELRRRDQTVARFEALLAEKLEPSIDDRGAARMLQQTKFLAAAFHAYEARVIESGALDEHALRGRLIDDSGATPIRHLVVTVGDRGCDPPGLWIADFDLMARIRGLESIDVIATENMLATGWHERLDAALPGIEAVTPIDGTRMESAPPQLVAPSRDTNRLHFVVRDREEELAEIARRVKAERRRDPGGFALDRHAVVFRRPLPYLYLARTVFPSARISYQASDAVPLAAEPFAAAVDLVLEAVTSGFTRNALVALLRSPHFVFGEGARRVGFRSIAALSRRLSEAGYLGGADALAHIAAALPETSAAYPAGCAVRLLAERLQPLAVSAPASIHLARLGDFLTGFESPGERGEREQRARDAVLRAIADLAAAHEQRDDPPSTIDEVWSRLRRWIDTETFRPETGAGGLRLVDADAAPYGMFDSMYLVGLIERDWPEPAVANIFYAPRLLAALGWSPDADRAAASRAAFKDLLTLAGRRAAFFTVTLEDESIVDASPFLDELQVSPLPVVREDPEPSRVFTYEALASASSDLGGNAGTADWLSMRIAASARAGDEVPGRALPHAAADVSISSVERYLECPFKYFAVNVLGLDEDPEDEDVMSPRTRGLFIHRVFQAFFEAWGQRGAITADRVEDARALFEQVAERELGKLSDAEAALERTRLFGSAVAVGLGDAVFRMEAERPARVVERLLEFPVRGQLDFHVGNSDPIRVAVRGIADRIDLLGDHTLRVLDYKTGKAPMTRRALQLPLYSFCASRQLTARDQREWPLGEAAYIAFGGPRAVVPMTSRGSDEQFMADAQGRLAVAVAAMRRGEFPVQPLEPFRCTFCAYAGVCRKDYVGDE